MNSIKKTIAILLTAALLCSLLSISAFAATVPGGENMDVIGSFAEGQAAESIYSISLAWGSMEFTYTDASEGVWNPLTLQYDGALAAAWACEVDANKITVANKSNAAVNASFAFADTIELIDIVGAFYQEAELTNAISTPVMIAAATPGVGDENGTATVNEAYLNLSGVLPSDGFVTSTKIGTVTVTIADINS